MRFMSDFREAMWGVVQPAISELDFDFAGYAEEHFERVRARAGRPARSGLAERARARAARARCVIIGGGVGGASIAYWLAELGWATSFSRARGADERLDVPLRRSRRPAARLARADADDDGLGRALPQARRRAGTNRLVECGSLRLASRAERWRNCARQAGWAKTFGLPLELISAAEAQRALPADDDRRRDRRRLAAERRLPRPEPLAYALADGARRGGAEIKRTPA